jgi:DNA-binding response OmpR family regulator
MISLKGWPTMTQTILIVEDEPGLQQLLTTELHFEGYQTLVAGDGEEALDLFSHHQLDLILLDWMLPKRDGLSVLRRIRRVNADLPIIFLTARDFSGDKVAGLDSGADDYITKPFDMEELLARIRVIFRHAKHQLTQTYSITGLTLDTKAHQARSNGVEIALTQREYALLLCLMQHANQTLDRDEILDAVWGTDFVGQANIVDVYVRQLRAKLAELHQNTFAIQTVRGIGYVLKEVGHD